VLLHRQAAEHRSPATKQDSPVEGGAVGIVSFSMGRLAEAISKSSLIVAAGVSRLSFPCCVASSVSSIRFSTDEDWSGLTPAATVQQPPP